MCARFHPRLLCICSVFLYTTLSYVMGNRQNKLASLLVKKNSVQNLLVCWVIIFWFVGPGIILKLVSRHVHGYYAPKLNLY